MNVAATGWLTVGLAPMTTITSELAHSENGAVTAPEPIVSIRAATDEAWQSRVQWSTLLPPNPARTSFWKRYASSFDPFAEPNPARARPPSRSRMRRRPAAATSSASSQVASRKWVDGFGRVDLVVRVLGRRRPCGSGGVSGGGDGGRSRTRTGP